MWVHTVSLCPPPALPHALVMRRRLIDWGWRYDYLSSPPPSHPPPPLSTFSRSLPNPGHSSEGDKACLLHVYRFVLIVRKQADSLRIKDGGWAHQGPAAVSAGLQRPPARMIRSSLLSWLGAREAAFAQKVAHILSVSPRWISRWINVNFVIRHKGLNNQTFLSQEPKKDDETFVFAKDFKSSFIFLFQESEKKGCYMGKIYFQFELFQWGKKIWFSTASSSKRQLYLLSLMTCVINTNDSKIIWPLHWKVIKKSLGNQWCDRRTMEDGANEPVSYTMTRHN